MLGWSPVPVQSAGVALAASVKTRTGGAAARARLRGRGAPLPLRWLPAALACQSKGKPVGCTGTGPWVQVPGLSLSIPVMARQRSVSPGRRRPQGGRGKGDPGVPRRGCAQHSVDAVRRAAVGVRWARSASAPCDLGGSPQWAASWAGRGRCWHGRMWLPMDRFGLRRRVATGRFPYASGAWREGAPDRSAASVERRAWGSPKGGWVLRLATTGPLARASSAQRRLAPRSCRRTRRDRVRPGYARRCGGGAVRPGPWQHGRPASCQRYAVRALAAARLPVTRRREDGMTAVKVEDTPWKRKPASGCWC